MEWITDNQAIVWWLTGIALVSSLIAAVALPVVIAKLPEDYFIQSHHPLKTLTPRRPLFWSVTIIFKNLLGILLFILGIVMLVTPGPGIIGMLLAVTLLDFPGKRRLQARAASIAVVHMILDAIRAKAGRPPFILPGRSSAAKH